MPSIVVSPAAESDIEEIWLFIAQDDELAASDHHRRMEAVFDRLLATPMMGRARPEFGLKGLRSFPIGAYTIYYCLAADDIEIVRIFHAARDIGPDYFPTHSLEEPDP